jgi:hypothetical protein
MRSTALCLAFGALAGCNGGPTGGDNPDMAQAGSPDMAQAASDMAGVTTFSYPLAPFTLQPGQEQINCYYVKADGVEKYVNRFVTDMNPGSHHLIVMRIDESQLGGNLPPPGPASCSDTPGGFDGMLPGSQQLHSDFTTPAGVAMKLSATHGLYFQSHYINASQAAITTNVVWSIDTVDKATVQNIAGIVFYSNWGLQVPPGMSVAKQTCAAPKDMFLITGTGHMHKRGTAFDATLNGTNIFHTNNWDEPDGAIYPSPGMAVKMGDPISWACTYDNMTNNTFTFGNSAATNEMCIFAAGYYPSVSGETIFSDFSCQ